MKKQVREKRNQNWKIRCKILCAGDMILYIKKF